MIEPAQPKCWLGGHSSVYKRLFFLPSQSNICSDFGRMTSEVVHVLGIIGPMVELSAFIHVEVAELRTFPSCPAFWDKFVSFC